MLGVASREAVRFSEAGFQGEAGAERRSSRSTCRWSEGATESAGQVPRRQLVLRVWSSRGGVWTGAEPGERVRGPSKRTCPDS